MQLLLKRGQGKDTFGRAVFDLWAGFELSGEESSLIRKYGGRDFILAEGDPQRDLTRAAKYAVALALIVFVFFVLVASLVAGLFFGVVALVGGTYGIYQYVREE